MAYDPKKYNHSAIEKKWQERWERDGAFGAEDFSNKEKNYLLIEFPYPSGDGLHVGHIRSWTALDAVARKRRAEGKNVLYPIGWDAFGLPAENYAIKTGVHPTITTKENTDNFRRQIKSLGLSFDWGREVNTTDPKYYKWTQWIFLQMYKKDLAYKAKIPVNWCPKDKIVLANEEVVDGCCERCGTPVERREKEQWMLAITKYAKRLYDDLDTVDYIEAAKVQQRNWIGPSEGAEIDFAVAGSDKKIRIFTTRPDTLFGATYMVLAPEHPLVAELAQRAPNQDEVLSYMKVTKAKLEIERTAEGKEKTGVEIKGAKAINPATKKEIPVFIADYVLGSYGTGAIMAVPAHDERDFAFAKKYNLPIRNVIEPVFVADVKEGLPFVEREAISVIIKHWSEDKYLGLKWKKVDWGTFITGGVEKDQTPEEAARAEILEETGFQNLRLIKTFPRLHSKFFHVPKNENRFAHFHSLYFELENGDQHAISESEKEKHDLVWLSPEEVERFLTPEGQRRDWQLLHGKSSVYTGEGILANSGGFDGLDSEEAKKKITEAVGGEWKTVYKLRDWVFSRQRYWGEPIPMVYCEKCGWQPVPEDELPVELPNVEKYQPTDTGESPLATMHEWVNTTCPNCKGPARRETDVMPNWAGSSWYYLRYCDPRNDKELAAQDKLKYWTPVDWYNGGMEHTTLHLLYSRFWHKFLFDIGAVPSEEPYKKRTSHGLILAEDGRKMSKSLGNVVSPDELVEKYGADALRLYEMFIGPFDQPVAWNSSAISGVQRFLDRVWRLKIDESSKSKVLMDSYVKQITNDIEKLKFNTAVSALMILLKVLGTEESVPRKAYEVFIKLLHPFAPHMTSELAEINNIDITRWPEYDESRVISATATVAIQVNGKVRATLELPRNASEEEAFAAARANPTVQKWLAVGEAKAIYVPGRIISFTTKGH